jgi:hypothetical protein
MTNDDIVSIEATAIALAEKLVKSNFVSVTATETNSGFPRDYLGTLRLNLRALARVINQIDTELKMREGF